MGKHIYAHIQGIQSFLSPCEYHLRKFDFRIDPLFFSRPAPNPPLPYIDSENITMGLLDLTTNRGSSNAKFLVFQVGMKFSDSNLRENFRNGWYNGYFCLFLKLKSRILQFLSFKICVINHLSKGYLIQYRLYYNIYNQLFELKCFKFRIEMF